MRPALRLAAVLAGAALLVSVIGLAAGWFNGPPPAVALPGPLSIATSLSPRPALFGDPLVAQIDVLLDASVAANSIRLAPDFAPYVERGRPSVARSRVGGSKRVRYRYTLECLTDGCLPVSGTRVLQFHPLRVTVVAGGRKLSRTGSWQPALVASRLQPADLAAPRPPFRRPATLPAPVFAVPPHPLAGWLAALAGLLVACGLGLYALEGRRSLFRAQERRLARLSPLDAALLYARESAGRPDPADRRKALGLLAETLAGEGDELARTAAGVAWGPPPPSPERTVELADRVEAEGERR